jgi:hypothetical protein
VYGKSAGKGAMAMGKGKKGGSSMPMAMPKKTKPAKSARPKAK